MSRTTRPIHVFGHRNPDTDSVVSAIALSRLKREQGLDTRPFRLGALNPETRFVLERFGADTPPLLEHVKLEVADLAYERILPLEPDHSIAHAYRHMQEHNLRTLPIVDEEKRLRGVMTMYDVAMNLVRGTEGSPIAIDTGYANMLYTIGGRSCTRVRETISGVITVTAFHTQTIIDERILHARSIVIVGDRHEIIRHAIEIGVELIIVTGGKQLPEAIRTEALARGVNMIITDHDTFQTAKLIGLANRIESIMQTEELVTFRDTDLWEDVREILEKSKHSKFPVVDESDRLLGILSRRDVLKPNRKQVILVDHNEAHQSARGIEQAQVLEIVDHHRIGNMATRTPINFRNETVGSTSTIVADMYRESGVAIPDDVAGLLLSGILSDTLYFKSPTSTARDRQNADALAGQLGLDLEHYAARMFRAGTAIDDLSGRDIFYADYKEFTHRGVRIGISQFATLDIDSIRARESEIHQMLDEARSENELSLCAVLITDIVHSGSYLYYRGNEAIVSGAVEPAAAGQGMFLSGVVSRKKQFLPALMHAIDMQKEGVME